jgi:hypothetical protein
MDMLITAGSFFHFSGLIALQKNIILFPSQPAKGWISACPPQGIPYRGRDSLSRRLFDTRIEKITNRWVVDLLQGNTGKFCQRLFKGGLTADHKTPEAAEALDAIGRVTSNE